MYATDLTDAQYEFIINSLEIKPRKRKHELRAIFNGIFYLVKTGCQWRMLPKEYPKWQLVYYYYDKWNENGSFDLLLDKVRGKARINKEQNENPTLGIMDSQTVRSANRAALKSVDGNKKIKGRKAAVLLMRKVKESVMGLKLIVADGGYRGELIEYVRNFFGYMIQIVMRSDNKKEFTPLPVRWVVERSFAWFDNDRRLCRDYEFLSESSEAMVKIAAIKLLLKKI